MFPGGGRNLRHSSPRYIRTTYFINESFFRFAELNTAASNFSPTNKLGEGRFGPVCKGVSCSRLQSMLCADIFAFGVLAFGNCKWKAKFRYELGRRKRVAFLNWVLSCSKLRYALC